MKFGVIFGEYIHTEKKSHRLRSFNTDFDKPKTRGFILLASLIFCIGILFFKLVELQIVRGSYYQELSDTNRTRTQVIHAPRGIIFDRNNVPLVFNTPGFRQTVNGKTTLLTSEDALSLIAKGEKGLEVDSLRSYPYKDILAHVLGYIGQISKSELKDARFAGYKAGDLIGKMGIEKQYQGLLVGADGKTLVEVDSMGKVKRTLGQSDPIPGKDITLTLDLNLQKKTYEAMKDVQKGAVIVSNPKGEILSMVSKPSFDPNVFTLGKQYDVATTSAYPNVSSVISDLQNQPLLNRAISGLYPPGSTFKLVVAASALQNKIIDDAFEVNDTGIIQLGPFSFSNWYFSQYGRTDGQVNVVKAIKRSNDIFFYKLAELVGPERIADMGKKFGLGGTYGIDLEGEVKGVIPDPSWKEKNIGDKWYLGDTYHYGIGQGYLLTTPLQVNMWTQGLANNGTLYQPRLLKDQTPKTLLRHFLDETTSQLIRQGMVGSCSSDGGVAWPLFNFKVKNKSLVIDNKNILESKTLIASPSATASDSAQASGSAVYNLDPDFRQVVIACKTGTAQHGGEKDMPHAWITLYAPAYNPQIIVTVLAESKGEGSNEAAPIAKKILEEWFSRIQQ